MVIAPPASSPNIQLQPYNHPARGGTADKAPGIFQTLQSPLPFPPHRPMTTAGSKESGLKEVTSCVPRRRRGMTLCHGLRHFRRSRQRTNLRPPRVSASPDSHEWFRFSGVYLNRFHNHATFNYPLFDFDETSSSALGAAGAERLDCSPTTKANRVKYPAGSLPDTRKRESCRTMTLVGGFSRRSPVSTALVFRLSPHFTLIGSREFGVKSRPNLSLAVLQLHMFRTLFRYYGKTAQLARRSDEALVVHVSVARIAPSLLDLGRGVPTGRALLALPQNPFSHPQESRWTEGAAVAQRLETPPLAKAVGSLPRLRESRAGRCLQSAGFLGGLPISPRPCIPALLRTHLASPSSALKTSVPPETLRSFRQELIGGRRSDVISAVSTPVFSGIPRIRLVLLRYDTIRYDTTRRAKASDFDAEVCELRREKDGTLAQPLGGVLDHLTFRPLGLNAWTSNVSRSLKACKGLWPMTAPSS
ncbi:hypothetical protein PR048_018875 [Dryococelus australis]|uniref:Uncharacterized protein n=1 Tax=Dryococelus australis TaxID=614101 RepID=A0ABQ9H1Z3_9NEOP|nr:hypothetical protein PR048_018875 [Dryococelus australis]